jgi:outer membrane lipoprotein-sorting protein
MQPGRNFAFFALVAAAALLAAQTVRAEDLKSVLERLDAAAQGFQTTSAHVEFDTIQTEPIPDKDVITGMAYYERKGDHFQMAAHLTEHNNHPTAKTYILTSGTLRVSDSGKASDAKVYTQAGKYESYLMLGFGAGGTQLEEKWTIKYLGTETIDGVKTDKLELTAKDPAVRKTIAKVTIWLDTSRAVSLKQVFDEGEGQSYVCYYTNIKVNQGVPGNAFAFDK